MTNLFPAGSPPETLACFSLAGGIADGVGRAVANALNRVGRKDVSEAADVVGPASKALDHPAGSARAAANAFGNERLEGRLPDNRPARRPVRR